MLTQYRVKELFDYNILTGDFIRKIDVKMTRAGDVAGHVNKNGYRIIKIDGKPFKAHRMVWLILYGKFPVNQIDHINGNRSDNRKVNLRDANPLQNTKNTKIYSTNNSGFIGVCLRKDINKWAAYIYADNKRHHLGCFKNKVDAISARKEAEEKYGFHKNHGRII